MSINLTSQSMAKNRQQVHGIIESNILLEDLNLLKVLLTCVYLQGK